MSNNEDDDNEQQISEMQFRWICVEDGTICFCGPIKGQSKTTKTYFCQFIHKDDTYWRKNLDWYWARRVFALRLFSVKKTDYFLRHGQLPREEDGAIEFWRLKDYLRNEFEHSQHWSDEMWKSRMAGGGINNKDFNIVLILQEKFFTSELFKVIQDAIALILHCKDKVLIPNNLFEYIYHVGCAINLHHQFRIDT